MTVCELAEKLSLKVITMPDGEREVEGAYIGDLLSWVMGRARSGNVWITIMSNQNIVAVASLSDVSCILLAEGVEPDATVAETAAGKDINILSTTAPAYEIAVALRESGVIPVSSL